MRRSLILTAAFTRAARRCAKRQPAALPALREALELLEQDAFDARLRTHKLQGGLAGSWACRAGYDLRIVFDFVPHAGAEAILLLSVGTHDEVY